jgi:N6-adenosine-specific RNA methylase IME4
MTSLVKYDDACRAIAEAKLVDEAKDIRDKAIAMAAYARQAKNTELEADCVEIRMRAERKVGELIKAQRETVGLNRGAAVPTRVDEKPTLADAGIDKNLAHRARTLAAASDTRFEQAVAQARDSVNRAVKNVVRQVDREIQRGGYQEQIQSGGTVADLHALIAAGKKFSVIYADPPWAFEVYSEGGKEKAADRYYDTMPLADIAALPVADLAADDCALLLWAVMPELPGALEIIEAWGFEYKTAGFTWMKQNKSGNGLFLGLGFWTRSNAEICLLATRGAPQRQALDVPQALLSPLMEHSRKPDEARSRIERLLPGPYLALQLCFLWISESMGNHDSNVVGACSVC